MNIHGIFFRVVFEWRLWVTQKLNPKALKYVVGKVLMGRGAFHVPSVFLCVVVCLCLLALHECVDLHLSFKRYLKEKLGYRDSGNNLRSRTWVSCCVGSTGSCSWLHTFPHIPPPPPTHPGRGKALFQVSPIRRLKNVHSQSLEK